MATLKTLTRVCRSEAETQDLGRQLGALLENGDFVGLIGTLGAGKTMISRAMAEGAGVDVADVSSPTYSILQTYTGARITLHHADLYRLTDEADLYATGYFDLLESEAAMLVEWVNHVPAAAPDDALLVTIAIDGETRRFDFAATGTRSERLLSRLKNAAPLSAP